MLFLLLLSGTAAAQEASREPEPGLFELRIRGSRHTLQVLVDQSTGAVLLPVLEVLELLGITYQWDAAAGELVVPTQPTETPGAVQLQTSTLVRGSASLQVSASELLTADDEVFLSAARFAWLVGGTARIEWGELAVELEREIGFPIQLRVAAERRRELARQLLVRGGRGEGVPERVPLPASTGGAVVDWGVTTNSSHLFHSSAARLGLGLAVAGGALQLTATGSPSVLLDSVGGVQGSALYRRIFPEGRLVRSIEAGEMMAGNVLARGVRGVTISNVSRLQDAFFDPILIRPEIPIGWEFELYRGGELVGFSSGHEQSVVVPLRYGANPLTVRMLGPAGEVVVSQLLLHVPVNQLRRGELEYTVGAGACPAAACDLYTFGSADYGITRWLSAGSGVEYITTPEERRVRGHGVLSVATLSGVTADVRVAPGVVSEARVIYSGAGPIHGHASTGVAHGNAARPSFRESEARRIFGEGSVATRAPAAIPRLRALRLDGRFDVAEGEEPFWRAGVFTSFRSWHHHLRYESSPFVTGHLVNLRSTWITPFTWRRPFRSIAITGGIGARDGAFDAAELSTTFQAPGNGTVFLSGRWGQSRGSVQVGLARTFGGARVQSRFGHSAGYSQGTVAADGALVLGGAEGVTSSATGGLGMAGVSGRIFYDHNRNGVFDEGDEPADSVPVLAGSYLVHSDAEGRFSAWGIAPHELVAVSADTLNIPDPNWSPLEGREVVRLVPNMYRRMDIALVRTVELVGRVVPTPGIPTVGGITVELHDEEAGTTSPVLTFSDGQFYVSRLRPGAYRVTLAASSLAALRARVEPSEIRFTAGAEEVLDLPAFTVHRVGVFEEEVRPASEAEP